MFDYDRAITTLPEDAPGYLPRTQDELDAYYQDLLENADRKAHALACEEMELTR